MRNAWLAALAAIPFAISCEKDEPIDDSGEGDADTDTDSDTDADADTDTDTDTDTPLEAVAIGLQFEFGWDQNVGIMDACYPDDTKKEGYFCNPPLVLVTLPNIDYFGSSLDQDADSCEFYALLKVAPGTFPAETYDFDSGTGAGTTKTTWASFEGTLSFDEKWIDAAKEPECFNLDKKLFPKGNPVDAFNGMHVGIGLGALTENLGTIFDSKTIDKYGDYLFTGFVAMNHPDGSGGVDFTGYDWNYSYLFEVDDKGVAVVDGKNLVFEDVTVPVNLRGLVRSFPYWYEDFPHLDFSNLKDDPK